jgi:hypothetical protein
MHVSIPTPTNGPNDYIFTITDWIHCYRHVFIPSLSTEIYATQHRLNHLMCMFSGIKTTSNCIIHRDKNIYRFLSKTQSYSTQFSWLHSSNSICERCPNKKCNTHLDEICKFIISSKTSTTQIFPEKNRLMTNLVKQLLQEYGLVVDF